MSFLHGIRVTETPGASATIAIVATACLGLVVTAPDASAAVFPLNMPVLVGAQTSALTIADAIAAAGNAGTMKASLLAIADQVRAPVVIVRVAPGANVADTEAAVIGADVNGAKTGMQALLAAEAQVKFRPRIIGAPGLDTKPVAMALAAVAKRLRGMAYAKAVGADRGAVIAYRAGFEQRELMLIWPDFTAPYGADGANVPSYAVASALGLRAKIDQTQGFHKTLSNVPVVGVTGLTKDIQFDLQDEDADANVLNAAGVTTLVRINGELRFWGNRTCAAIDSDFSFESATRTAQVLADSIVAGMIWAMDKPLLPSLARDIVEQINAAFRKLPFTIASTWRAIAALAPAPLWTDDPDMGGAWPYERMATLRELAGETRAAADASYGDFETVGLADAVETLIWWETASPPARAIADCNIIWRIANASRPQTRPREHRTQPTRPAPAPATPIAPSAGPAPVQTTLFGVAA